MEFAKCRLHRRNPRYGVASSRHRYRNKRKETILSLSKKKKKLCNQKFTAEWFIHASRILSHQKDNDPINMSLAIYSAERLSVENKNFSVSPMELLSSHFQKRNCSSAWTLSRNFSTLIILKRLHLFTMRGVGGGRRGEGVLKFKVYQSERKHQVKRERLKSERLIRNLACRYCLERKKKKPRLRHVLCYLAPAVCRLGTESSRGIVCNY